MEMAPSPVETMPSNSFLDESPQFESVDATDISTQSKEEGLVSTNSIKMQVETPSVVPAAPILIPSLKGMMTYSGGIVTCKGRWAMSDDAHDIEGQSSEFEFKLIKADADSGFFPINGKYQGWFHIKQAPPLKAPLKVEDKDMIMKFVPLGEGKFSINGQGHNRLGKFNLRGTLTNDGAVHIYREYYQLTPVPVPQQKKVPPPRRESIDKTKDVPEEPPVATPREGAARIRKQSSLLKEFHDPLQKPPAISRSVSKDVIRRSSSASTAPFVPNVAERSHRLSAGMKKCLDLLKDLSRLPQAQWFLEPVDPVKFNIPDYPKIIKFPMDFSTIRKNIEEGAYDSIHGFAEHMRLVFRNAITYNQAKDSLVNIAARELSNKFEDKFRGVVTQLDPSTMMMVEDVKVTKLSGLKRSKSKDIASLKSMKLPPGPRQSSGQFGLPPAAVDGSTMKILEMQQIIANMQDELKQLRTVVKESEISKRLNEAKEAAQNPLSFEEKKVLVGQIHKLSEDKMERVLAIIQEAMPQCSEGVVEIPIDSLDTLTLRKLQTFVQANVVEKKKRSMNVKLDSANKRPRKSRAPSNRSSNNNLSGGGVDGLAGHDDLNLFDAQDDDLLFEPDSFEDIKEEGDAPGEDAEDYAKQVLEEYEKLKGNGNVFVDEHGNIDRDLTSSHAPTSAAQSEAVEEEDDDNLWSEAAAEIHNQKQVHPEEDYYQV